MSIFNDDYSYQTHKDGDGDPFDDDYLMQINNHKAPITADDLYEDYSNPVTRRRNRTRAPEMFKYIDDTMTYQNRALDDGDDFKKLAQNMGMSYDVTRKYNAADPAERERIKGEVNTALDWEAKATGAQRATQRKAAEKYSAYRLASNAPRLGLDYTDMGGLTPYEASSFFNGTPEDRKAIAALISEDMRLWRPKIQANSLAQAAPSAGRPSKEETNLERSKENFDDTDIPTDASKAPKIPAYRHWVVQTKDWEQWHETIRTKGLGAGQTEAYMQIFAAEGGIQHDGSTTAGIMQKTLDRLEPEDRKALNIPAGTTPRQLTPEQRLAAYKNFFDDIIEIDGKQGGAWALDTIGDPQAAAALADALFREGRPEGTKIIQRAINKILPGQVKVDAHPGKDTFAAYKSLVRDPGTRRWLLDNIADGRTASRPSSANLKGEKARADHFRFR